MAACPGSGDVGEDGYVTIDGEIDIGQSADRPREKYGHRCREATVLAVRAFLDLFDAAVTGDTIAVETVRRIANAVMTAEGALSHYYDLHADGCAAFFEMAKAERKRIDYFGRVIAEPLVGLLNNPTSGVQRKNLPHFFLAVRMTLGDELYTEYRDRCIRLANDLRGGSNLLLWPDFFADRRSLDILEQVQVAMAQSFRQFAPRKAWFLAVMNADLASVSQGNVPEAPQESDKGIEYAFGEEDFVRLFLAFFARARPERYSGDRRSAFVTKFAADPEAIFGPLLAELKPEK